MADFVWSPDYGARKRQQPRVDTVAFGDGYTQRAGSGINYQEVRTWEYTFSNSAETIDTIDAFLRTKGGVTSFTFRPPRAITDVTVICSTWEVEETEFGARLTATFEYQPG